MKGPRLARALGRVSRVCLDSAVPIYHLEDVAPYSELTEVIFTSVAGGSLSALVSTVSVTELLVRPFARAEGDTVEACERFLLSMPNLVIVPPTYGIAKEAARLRARYGMRTPDALLVATALDEKADAFVTNDTRLRRLKAEGIAVVVLDDFV
jgi:predicted nucleic acid-binding protein